MPRFPFPIPYGWFQVGYPDDLEPGGVKPLRYWGHDLVLWREEGGDYHLHEAFCPHLGAHLGYGGRVAGDQIQCPFHGWRFDGAGACAHVPYSQKINRKARIQPYPLLERNGLLMAWYHPHGIEPQWDIPVMTELEDPEFIPYLKSEFTVKTALQEMAENTVDAAHFQYVHGTDDVAEITSYKTDGHRGAMTSIQRYVTPRGVVVGEINASQVGPGFSFTWFTGIIDALLIGCATPIDEETVHQRFNFTARVPDGDDGARRLADAFIAMVNHQFTEDMPIWEHKRHLPVPALADTDGPFMDFRRWYKQFYVEEPVG